MGDGLAVPRLCLHFPSSHDLPDTPTPHPACQSAVALGTGGCISTSRRHHPPTSPTPQLSHPTCQMAVGLRDGRLHLHFSIVDPIARPILLGTRTIVRSSLRSHRNRARPLLSGPHQSSLSNTSSVGPLQCGSVVVSFSLSVAAPTRRPVRRHAAPLQPAATLGGGAVAAGALNRTRAHRRAAPRVRAEPPCSVCSDTFRVLLRIGRAVLPFPCLCAEGVGVLRHFQSFAPD